VLKWFAPDIVHSHLNAAARRVGRTGQRLGIPHVATLHLNFDRPELGACDGVILVNNAQRALVPADFEGMVEVIWNWVPETVHTALEDVGAADVAALRRSWGADDATFVFGSVGRIVQAKGMDALVRAFQAAFPQGQEAVQVVIVGGGPHQDALSGAAKSDRRIAFAGARADVATFYRAFDAYVSAARFEPFGLSILEAMDAGLPLVVTRTDGPRDFVSDARVLWADIDDEPKLAEQMRTCFEHGRVRLNYDLTRFAPAVAAEQIDAFYQRVIFVRQR